MGDYIRYDQDGKIINKYVSVDGGDIKDDADILQVDRPTLESITKYHKVINDTVVEMSQLEKDVLDQAEADAKEQAVFDAIDKYEISNVDLITALVQVINKRIPSNIITKAEITQQIKDNR